MQLEQATHARKSSVRLGISDEKFARIFGKATNERGKTTYILSADQRRQQELIEESRKLRSRWESCFGPPPVIRRGTYRRTLAGDFKHWDDFTPTERADYLAAQRGPSTRVHVIGDIDPFMTGKMDGAQYIGSRTDKRDYMRATGLVEFEDFEAPSKEHVPDEGEIRASIDRVLEMDQSEIIPKEKATELAMLDGATPNEDDPLAGILPT